MGSILTGCPIFQAYTYWKKNYTSAGAVEYTDCISAEG